MVSRAMPARRSKWRGRSSQAKGYYVAAEQRTPGIALVCSTDGATITTLRDEIGLPDDFATGSHCEVLAAPGSEEKCLNFLKCVKAGRAAFDWEMDIRTRLGPLTLFVFGALEQDRLLILGATTPAGALGLAGGLLAENDDQVHAVHAALKRIAVEHPSRVASDHELFKELTRLNNDLADAQRALAKTNVELARLSSEKARFMGIAAHDLRNSIAIVQTYSDYVLEGSDAALGPELMQFISIIRTSSEGMLRLIDDLLDMSV